MTARVTVVGVVVAIQRGDALHHVEIAAAFDPIRSADAAVGCGRAIGEHVGQFLDRQRRLGLLPDVAADAGREAA